MRPVVRRSLAAFARLSRVVFSASRIKSVSYATSASPSGRLMIVPVASADLLVVVTREGHTGQGGCAAHGARERGHHAERVHAGAGRLAAGSGRQGRIRIVHHCSHAGRQGRANSLKRVARPAGLEPATSWFVVATEANAPVVTDCYRVRFRPESERFTLPATATIYYRL